MASWKHPSLRSACIAGVFSIVSVSFFGLAFAFVSAPVLSPYVAAIFIFSFAMVGTIPAIWPYQDETPLQAIGDRWGIGALFFGLGGLVGVAAVAMLSALLPLLLPY